MAAFILKVCFFKYKREFFALFCLQTKKCYLLIGCLFEKKMTKM